MRISVVIPCHGGVEDTRACLRSLGQCALPPQTELELIVVDNASPDETATLDTEFEGVRVVRQETNLGFAGGVNRGLHTATGSHLLILNNDTLAAPSLLVRLVTALESDPRIALCGPVSNHVKGHARIPIAGNLGETIEGRVELDTVLAEDGRTVQDVPTLSGLCLLLRRSTWQVIGDFDERFGSGNWEDDDYSLRARLLGFRLVVARSAFLHHHGHRTFQAMGLDLRAEIEQRRRTFIEKWRGLAAARAYLAEYDGKFEEAAFHAEHARRESPLWLDADRLLGKRELVRGNYQVARQLLQAHLESCPLASETSVLLAVAELEAGEAARGLRTFSRAVSRCWFNEVEMARALGLLADYWLRRNAPDRATPFAQEAIELDPENGPAHNRAGVILVRQQRYDEAEEAFIRAESLGCPEASANRARLVAARSQAIATAQR